MLSDILDFFEFLGCLANLPFGEGKQKRKEARARTRVARRKRLKASLGVKSTQAYFDNRTGTIAHDVSKVNIGIAVGGMDVMRFHAGKVPKLARCPSDPTCVEIELHIEPLPKKVYPLHFATPEQADYWYRVLQGA